MRKLKKQGSESEDCEAPEMTRVGRHDGRRAAASPVRISEDETADEQKKVKGQRI